MAHDPWGTKHVTGVRKDIPVYLWEDEKQVFCSWLKTTSLAPMEQWVIFASLCFLLSWPGASSWEWPCGCAMTHRQRISCTCSWGTSRPPTPSTSVSSCGGAGVVPQKQGRKLQVSNKQIKMPPAALVLAKIAPAVPAKAFDKCWLRPKRRVQIHTS